MLMPETFANENWPSALTLTWVNGPTPAELAQALAQRGEVGGVRRGRLALEHGDAVDLVLRRGGERGKQYQ